MSDFVMTLEERSDVSASSSDDEQNTFSFDFHDEGLETSIHGGKTHAWNFEAARAGLRQRDVPRKTVDDIIQKQLSKSKLKQTKKSAEEEEEEISQSESMSGDDSNEEVSDMEVDSNDESVENSEESENESNESDEESNESNDENDEDEEDHVEESDEDDEDDDENESSERNRNEAESMKELRDITRKTTKKHMDLLNQLTDMTSFEKLKLSRPLLKALTEMGFTKPTPVQMNCIPPALKGRDICASAITGSGKTAAFILPILERLLYRNTAVQVTRVLILMPTRELAVQCHSVITNLAKYTNGISAALVTGGMSSKKQEVDLRNRPDIIVATPGRVLDHVLNTQAFGLDDIEILVLDEADRLLELGFMEQIEQVVKACPKKRQTMLFSATMTDRVDQLASLSLQNPALLNVDPMFQVARKLTQEFVRVRSGSERDKQAVLLSLCTRTFKEKVIIFCTHKATAHKLKIIFTLAGLKASELHGDLTQEQRFDSLEAFRDQKVDFLIASDVASRGLDVIGVDTVINYELPIHLANYVHRVGRTARAGRSGRAVSLVTEADRRLFKVILKNSHNSVKQRVVPSKSLVACREKIDSMASAIENVLQEEVEDKLLRLAEMEANRTSNLIQHHDEIMSRPKKTWFQNEQQKKALNEESKRVHLGKPKFEIDEDGEEDGEKSSKKRKREAMEATNTKYDIKFESKKAKKRKLTEDDKKDLKAQRALLRQRKREKLGKTAEPVAQSGVKRLSSTKKTNAIKLNNKQASKKKQSTSTPTLRKENRDKGKSMFGAEMRTAGFKKKSGGGFKSKSKHKRR